jgi:hypothetical protein
MVNLDISFSCDYDYLNIYDGNSKSAKLIGKFCGGSDVEVVSSSRYLYLEFHSDDSNEFTGFRFKYSVQQRSGTVIFLHDTFQVISEEMAFTLYSLAQYSYKKDSRDI